MAPQVEPVGCHQHLRQHSGADSGPACVVELPSEAGDEEAQERCYGDQDKVDALGSPLSFEVLRGVHDFTQHVPDPSRHNMHPTRNVARKRVVPRFKEYSHLKIGEDIFRPGDTVSINEYSDSEAYATIVKIIGFPQRPLDSTLTVRWFYKPTSLFAEPCRPIGPDELFDSDHEDEVSVLALSGKIQVLTLERYLQLDSVPEDVFYSRATYKYRQEVLHPPSHAWKRVCVCDSVLYPLDVYRVCASCQQFFHPSCVGPDVPGWKCLTCIAN